MVEKCVVLNVVLMSVMMAHNCRTAHTSPPQLSAPHTSLTTAHTGCQGGGGVVVLCQCRGQAAPGPTSAKVVVAFGLITELIFGLYRVSVELARYCLQQPPAFRPVGVK